MVLAFRNIGIESHGVDISDYALSQAPDEVRPYLFRVDLDEERLPFGDQRFDLITALGVMPCLNSHVNAINEVSRVVRDRGIFLMTTVYRKVPLDKFRMNVRSKEYWVENLERHGFHFIRRVDGMERFYSLAIKELPTEPGSTIKTMCGKFVNRFPKLGPWMVMRYWESRWGILFFRSDKKGSSMTLQGSGKAHIG